MTARNPPRPVACVRCAVAAAHPGGHYPRVCPACGRDRDRAYTMGGYNQW